MPCLSVCDVGVLWPNGCMDQHATWYGGRPQPRPHSARRGSSSPTERSKTSPLFGPCILWPNGRPSQQLLSSCYSLRHRHNCCRKDVAVSATAPIKLTRQNRAACFWIARNHGGGITGTYGRPCSLPADRRVRPIGVWRPAAAESAAVRRRRWRAASVVHRHRTRAVHTRSANYT